MASRIALPFATALVLCWACNEPLESRGIRHVLLVSLDTTRTDHLGCYGAGREATPHLDALAAESVRFDQVLAPAPTTLASHTSMMTGLYPRRHGVAGNYFVIDEENRMLAEILGEAGFHTSAVLGSFALDRTFGFDQGFDHFDRDFDVLVSLRGGTDQNQRVAENVTSAALEHLDRVGSTKERIFMFVHYFDPHAPYAPPPEFAERFAEQGAPLVSKGHDLELATRTQQRALIGTELGHGAVMENGLEISLLDRVPGGPLGRSEDMADLYAAEVAYLDEQLGRLFDGLHERELLEETLVIVTGDHGETFWEHGDFWNHGLWLFETTVRVPWILRFPEDPEGTRPAERVVRQPVSTVDLVPTLCQLLELSPPPSPLDGVSLVPAIEGAPFSRGPVFSEATQPWSSEIERDGLPWPGDLKPRAVRVGDWKYIHAPYVAAERGGYEQLFDLSRDPDERENLLERSEVPRRVRVRARILRKLLDAYAELTPMVEVRKTYAQQREVYERLQQLGYAGPGGKPSVEEANGR